MVTYKMNDEAHQKIHVGDENGVIVIGGAGAHDTLVCGNGDDCQLIAGSGAHQLLVMGNGQRNRLIGGSGAWDVLVGGNGGCKFTAGSGSHQFLKGGDGDDSFHFAVKIGADDTVDGGLGRDTVYFDNHSSEEVEVVRENEIIIQVNFTDIGRSVVLRNIQTVVFNDGVKVGI